MRAKKASRLMAASLVGVVTLATLMSATKAQGAGDFLLKILDSADNAKFEDRMNVRLANGTTSPKFESGLIEVSTNGVDWMNMCTSVVNKNLARVLCRMRGFQKAELVGEGFYGNGTNRIFDQEIICNSGAINITDCTMYSSQIHRSSCTKAGVICFNETQDVLQLQLSGNVNTSVIKTGFLEVRLADVGLGAVCEWGFTLAAANLACQTMGYRHGEFSTTNLPEDFSPSFVLERMYCNKETSFLDCSHELVNGPTCYPGSFVALRCVNASVRLRSPHNDVINAGSVELYSKGKGWIEVCDKDWDDQDAGVVCRELGFVDGKSLCCNQLGINAWGSFNVHGAITNVTCTGRENSLENCTKHNTESCPFDNRNIIKLASVICYNHSADQMDSALAVRLVHGKKVQTDAGWGSLQVRRYEFWGDVCLDVYSDQVATVACRMMGFSGGKAHGGHGNKGFAYSGNSIWVSKDIFASAPVWLTEVTCNGTEASLADCAIPGWGSPADFCTEGSNIICYRSELEITLHNADLQYGRLDVLYDGVKGTICAEGFTDFDAGIACKTMNYFQGKVLKLEAGEEGTGPVYLTDVRCSTTDDTLFKCDSQWKNASADCRSHSMDAGVICFRDIALRSGDHRSGVVGVYSQQRNDYNVICGKSFDDQAAKVVCKNLGFANGYALPSRVYGDQTWILADNLTGIQCHGNETNLNQCPVNQRTVGYCYRGDYAAVSCFNTEQNLEKYQLTLGPQEGQAAGVVSIFYKQTYGYICNSIWNDQSANVLCRQMGHQGGVAYTYPVRFAGPYFISNSNCTGNESAIENCTSMDMTCSSNQTPGGVLCYQSQAPRVTLIQEASIPHRGRVAIEVDGEQGRVCGTGWSTRNAMTVCKELGYVDGVAVTFARSSRPFYMQNVNCIGSEKSLFHCTNFGWRRPVAANCSESNASEAGAMCFKTVKLTGGTITDKVISGNLQVYVDSWVSVCAGIGRNETVVACREMGFQDGILQSRVYGAYSSSPRYSVRCRGDEKSMINCSRSSTRCSYVSRIVCFNNSNDADWIWDIQLADHGLVRVTYQDVTGDICETGWNDRAANTLCRQKGFKGGIAFGTATSAQYTSDLVWLSNVSCPRGASNMSQCQISTNADPDCSASYPASVLCYNVSEPKVRLVGRTSPMEGLVQIEYDGVNGSVCNTSWSRYDARAVCRQLGYADGIVSSFPVYRGITGPVYLDNMRCSFDDVSLFACPSRGWNTVGSACSNHARDAGVTCFTSVRLSISKTLGPVNYYDGYTYVLVCADFFDDRAAEVICREMGFQSGVALYAQAFDRQTLSIGVSKVHCLGSEQRVEECTVDGSSYCPTRTYASAVCSETERITDTYSVRLENGSHGSVVVEFFGHYGYICSSGYDDADARVLCREAGYLTGFAYRVNSYISQSDIFWLGDLNCTGFEERIDRCHQGNQTLRFGKYPSPRNCTKAGAFCANSNDQVKIDWRLAGNTNKTESSHGRVEVRINGTWSSVCRYNFAAASANVFCQYFGYASGDILDNRFGSNPNPIWMTEVNCTGNETTILDCPFKIRGIHDVCLQEVAIDCNGGVRWKEDTGKHYGQLQVLVSPLTWVSVCSYRFTNNTANVVCREMAYSSGFFQNIVRDSLEQAQINGVSLTCPQDGTFSQCAIGTSYPSSCIQESYVLLFCLVADNPREDLGIKMDGLAGMPLVSRYGFEGSICGTGFTDREASVACKHLGYTAGYALKAVPTPLYMQPYVLSGLNCTGNESKLDECPRGSFINSSMDCRDSTSAHIICSSTSDPVTFRLNPAGSTSGRAEIFLNGQWKLIDRYDFQTEEATVFCRSIGFAAGDVSTNRYNDLEMALIGVGEVNCTGNETSFLQCQGNWTMVRNQFKPSSYGVTVNCEASVKLSRGTNASGVVEYNNEGRWGPVCGDDFDNRDAAVVCRELGFSDGVFLCCSPFGTLYGPFEMNQVECHGNETKLEQCNHTRNENGGYLPCRYMNYASVACFEDFASRNYSLAFYEKSEFSGSVQVTYAGVAGRICNDSWDDADARVACREMGFQDGQAYSHYRDYYSYNRYNGPYWSSQFNCSGSERRLGECPHVEFGHVTECKNTHFAGALCFDEHAIAYRLSNNKTGSNYGIVEVRINGQWGAVCSFSWNFEDARVFCRSLGFVDGATISDSHIALPTTGPLWSANLQCSSSDTELNKCIHDGWARNRSDRCNDNANLAEAFCYTNVRLTSGPGQSYPHGPVELYYNGSWFLVCDAGFDDITATAVCQELGYVEGQAICCSAYAPVYLYPQINPNVTLHCTGDEASLDQCILTSPCRSPYYASVVCLNESASYNETEFTIERMEKSNVATNTGHLTVEHYGVTGRICAVNWTDEDAVVFCKSKLYSSGFAYVHSYRQSYPSEKDIGPIFLSNFQCTGKEANLMDCPHSGRLSLGNCSAGHSAAVVCYRESGIQYRLAGGRANSGRVELAIENVWGTICNEYWSNPDADVACRSLNYTSGLAQFSNRPGTGSGPIWLRTIDCVGTEKALHLCPHSGFTDELATDDYWDYNYKRYHHYYYYYNHRCDSHEADAEVFCFKNARLNSNDINATLGALKLYHKGRFVSACDTHFTNTEAAVACKSLLQDYSYGVVIKGSSFGNLNVSLNITSVKCHGNENDIADCVVEDTGSCSSGYYASIACSNTSFPSTGYSMRLSDDAYSGAFFGIVEVFDNGVWKRICQQGWDEADANVTCRELGFKGGVVYTHIYKHKGPIGFRDFRCSGRETSLQQCAHETSPDLENCAFEDYDAGVVCYNSSGISYRLKGGNSSSSGQVEIIYDGQAGKVCPGHWNFNDSRVLCRSLSYVDGMPLTGLEYEGAREEEYFLNAPLCGGTERFLLECLNSGFNSSYMKYSCYGQPAAASCFNQTVHINDTRLVSSNGQVGTNEGRVEIFLVGPNAWGTVCDDIWDTLDATVVCVSLGFAWGEVNFTHGEGKGQIWLDDVECIGHEKSLDECRFPGYGTHNCAHREDAGVTCYSTTRPTLPMTTTTAKSTTVINKTVITPGKGTTPNASLTKTAAPVTPVKSSPTSSTASTSPSTPNETINNGLAHAHKGSDDTVSIAAGVTVSIILIAVIAVILIFFIKRRHLFKSSISHQRFSNDVFVGASRDGSIAMQNQMFDRNHAEVDGDAIPNSAKYMAGEGEITLERERAVYNGHNQHEVAGLDNGFANPLYSVMQPLSTDIMQLPPDLESYGKEGSKA